MNITELDMNIDEYLPLRDIVFHTLRKGIITGQLSPGERLMEVNLAKQLGVSRTPVREAIRKLELEGLVTMVPRKGARVASITEKNLRDIMELRSFMEQFAVSLACQRIDEEGLRKLEAAHHDFKKVIDANGDTLEIIQKDIIFHNIIFLSTGNQPLIAILNSVREQFMRYRTEFLRHSDVFYDLVSDHELLLETISRRDEKRATEVMSAHINRQLETLLKILEDL